MKSYKWKKFKLGDAAEEVRKLFEPSKESVLSYIGLEHIEQYTLKLNGVGKSTDTISTKKRFEQGDILFGSLRPYFRKVVRPKFKGVCSTDITVIKAKPGFNVCYLHYLIASQNFIDRASNVSSGTRMPRASWKVLSETEWNFPPAKTQRKIAAILSTYDDLIENNLRRIKILEELAQNLYREWFVNFRFPGHEQVRFVDSPLGRIPEGWKVKPLDEVVTTQYGYTESAQNEPVGPKYLRGKDINKTSYIDWEYVPYCSIATEKYFKYKLHRGDIVVIRMADPGKIGIVEDDIDAVFASYLVRLNSNRNVIAPYYLFYYLNSDKYQGYITGASTGTTRKSASAGVMTGIDILLPKNQVLDNFETQITSYRQFMNNLLKRNTSLRQTRDLLLPKLISGEVDVSELDINVIEEEAV